MTTARDDLVDVIAEALLLGRRPNHQVNCKGCDCAPNALTRYQAQGVLAALVERYGEPEIEVKVYEYKLWGTHRRLVFPWRAQTGDNQ